MRDHLDRIAARLVADEIDEVASLALQSAAAALRGRSSSDPWASATGVHPIGHQPRAGKPAKLHGERRVASIESDKERRAGGLLGIPNVSQLLPAQGQRLLDVDGLAGPKRGGRQLRVGAVLGDDRDEVDVIA